ncbi:MAG TPA: hypothetical protein VIC08_05850 [Cellvibrionaceae bacterium]
MAEGSGTLRPSQTTIQQGESLSIDVLPSEGYVLDNISGCNGNYNNGTFFIDTVLESCTLTAIFEPIAITIDVNVHGSGQYHTSAEAPNYGDGLTLDITPEAGYYLESATGCAGETVENTYTIDRLTNDCSIDLVFTVLPPLPDSPKVWFDYQSEKIIRFHWDQVEHEKEFQLLERLSENATYEVVATLDADTQTYDHRVFLLTHTNASYTLQACNVSGCSESNTVSTSENILSAAGRWERSLDEINPSVITINESGSIMLISESSPYTTHIYTKDNSEWRYAQELIGSARNLTDLDNFGEQIALSAQGKVIAVGASCDSNATRLSKGGEPTSDRTCSGAVYIYRQHNGVWEENAYIKPSDLKSHDFFGAKIGLSEDGNTLAVLSSKHQTLPDETTLSGAIHLYRFNNGLWEEGDTLTTSCNLQGTTLWSGNLAVADNGNIVALSAPVSFQFEITPLPEGYPENFLADPCYRGFVYIFQKNGDSWQEERIIPTDGQREFGGNFTISEDGSTFSSAGSSPVNLYVYENDNGVWKNTFLEEGNTKGTIDATGDKLVILNNIGILDQRQQLISLYAKKSDEWTTAISDITVKNGYFSFNLLMEFLENGEALYIAEQLYDENSFIIHTY